MPPFSTCGPHEHHWLSGTESRTDGMWEPQPIQVLPSVQRFGQKRLANTCKELVDVLCFVWGFFAIDKRRWWSSDEML